MDRSGTIIACALIVAATWLLNMPSLDYGFVYDDQALIIERLPVSEEGIGTALLTRHWGTARKAALFSLELDRRTPLIARPFHTTNLMLATVAALLVFGLARALSISTLGAAAAGLLFTLHPIHTDAVASIIGRAELLAAIGVLGALIVHIRGYPGGLGSRAVAAGAFALAMLSKENAAVLLGLLLLYDLSLGRRRLREALYSLLPYLAVLFAWAALALAQEGELAAIPAVDNHLAQLPTPWRIAMAAEILWRYLGLTLMPVGLLPERSYATVVPNTSTAVVAALAWAVGLTLVWKRRRQAPLLVFCALWFPLAFAATSNVIFAIGTNMAERLAFLPSVGPCLLAAIAVTSVASGGRRGMAAAILLVFVASILLVPAYRTRASVWSANEHYHRRSTELSPDSAKAWYNLGMVQVRKERPRLALRAFTRSAEVMPDFDMAAWWRAALLIGIKQQDAAETVYRDYLRLRPEDAGMTSHLVTLLLKDQRYDEALVFAKRMAEVEPDYAETAQRIEDKLEQVEATISVAEPPPLSP